MALNFPKTNDFNLNRISVDENENSLEIKTCEEEEMTEKSRTTRRRSGRLINKVLLKKPESNVDLDKVQKYYLCSRVTRLPPKLETIFEEPKKGRQETLYMSSRKYRRVISFDDCDAAAMKEKLRKRQVKVKQHARRKQGKRKCKKSTPNKKRNGRMKTGKWFC